jgi:hypothetical protein
MIFTETTFGGGPDAVKELTFDNLADARDHYYTMYINHPTAVRYQEIQLINGTYSISIKGKYQLILEAKSKKES